MSSNISKLLVFDVDGTVTKSCQVITEKMAKMLNSLPYEIAFVSGTDVKELRRMVSLQLTRNHYLLGDSGGNAVHMKYGNFTAMSFNVPLTKHYKIKTLWSYPLTKQEKTEILATLTNTIEKFKIIPETSDQILFRNSQVTLSCLGRSAKAEHKTNYDKNKTKRKKYIEFLQSQLSKKYTISIGGTTSIDITKNEINKATMLKKFMNEFNCNDVTYFGDQLTKGGNDYCVKSLPIKIIAVKNEEDCHKKLRFFL